MRPLSTRSTYDALLEVLARHLSPLNAQLVLRRAIREVGLVPERISPRDLRRLAPRLEHAARLFVEESKIPTLVAEATSLAGADPPAAPGKEEVAVLVEADISRARVLARKMCEDLGTQSLAVQKISTVVSELARNIVDYTPGGRIELAVDPTKRRILIRATDQGSGIKNLEEILSGRYRSRTGLGVGLLGSKRLADRFDIQTGSTGTRIEVEVRL